jgi:hypothetical protein
VLYHVIEVHRKKLKDDTQMLAENKVVHHLDHSKIKRLVQNLEDSDLNEPLLKVRWFILYYLDSHRLRPIRNIRAFHHLAERSLPQLVNNLKPHSLWIEENVPDFANVVTIRVVIAVIPTKAVYAQVTLLIPHTLR